MVLLTFGLFFCGLCARAGCSAFACVCVGCAGIRCGCIDRCDPDDRDFLISAIAIVANFVTAMIAIIVSTIPIICAIDVILLVAATIAIVVVAIAIVWIDNLGF